MAIHGMCHTMEGQVASKLSVVTADQNSPAAELPKSRVGRVLCEDIREVSCRSVPDEVAPPKLLMDF